MRILAAGASLDEQATAYSVRVDPWKLVDFGSEVLLTLRHLCAAIRTPRTGTHLLLHTAAFSGLPHA